MYIEYGFYFAASTVDLAAKKNADSKLVIYKN